MGNQCCAGGGGSRRRTAPQQHAPPEQAKGQPSVGLLQVPSGVSRSNSTSGRSHAYQSVTLSPKPEEDDHDDDVDDDVQQGDDGAAERVVVVTAGQREERVEAEAEAEAPAQENDPVSSRSYHGNVLWDRRGGSSAAAWEGEAEEDGSGVGASRLSAAPLAASLRLPPGRRGGGGWRGHRRAVSSHGSSMLPLGGQRGAQAQGRGYVVGRSRREGEEEEEQEQEQQPPPNLYLSDEENSTVLRSRPKRGPRGGAGFRELQDPPVPSWGLLQEQAMEEARRRQFPPPGLSELSESERLHLFQGSSDHHDSSRSPGGALVGGPLPNSPYYQPCPHSQLAPLGGPSSAGASSRGSSHGSPICSPLGPPSGFGTSASAVYGGVHGMGLGPGAARHLQQQQQQEQQQQQMWQPQLPLPSWGGSPLGQLRSGALPPVGRERSRSLCDPSEMARHLEITGAGRELADAVEASRWYGQPNVQLVHVHHHHHHVREGSLVAADHHPGRHARRRSSSLRSAGGSSGHHRRRHHHQQHRRQHQGQRSRRPGGSSGGSIDSRSSSSGRPSSKGAERVESTISEGGGDLSLLRRRGDSLRVPPRGGGKGSSLLSPKDAETLSSSSAAGGRVGRPRSNSSGGSSRGSALGHRRSHSLVPGSSAASSSLSVSGSAGGGGGGERGGVLHHHQRSTTTATNGTNTGTTDSLRHHVQGQAPLVSVRQHGDTNEISQSSLGSNATGASLSTAASGMSHFPSESGSVGVHIPSHVEDIRQSFGSGAEEAAKHALGLSFELKLPKNMGDDQGQQDQQQQQEDSAGGARVACDTHTTSTGTFTTGTGTGTGTWRGAASSSVGLFRLGSGSSRDSLSQEHDQDLQGSERTSGSGRLPRLDSFATGAPVEAPEGPNMMSIHVVSAGGSRAAAAWSRQTRGDRQRGHGRSLSVNETSLAESALSIIRQEKQYGVGSDGTSGSSLSASRVHAGRGHGGAGAGAGAGDGTMSGSGAGDGSSSLHPVAPGSWTTQSPGSSGHRGSSSLGGLELLGPSMVGASYGVVGAADRSVPSSLEEARTLGLLQDDSPPEDEDAGDSDSGVLLAGVPSRARAASTTPSSSTLSSRASSSVSSYSGASSSYSGASSSSSWRNGSSSYSSYTSSSRAVGDESGSYISSSSSVVYHQVHHHHHHHHHQPHDAHPQREQHQHQHQQRSPASRRDQEENARRQKHRVEQRQHRSRRHQQRSGSSSALEEPSDEQHQHQHHHRRHHRPHHGSHHRHHAHDGGRRKGPHRHHRHGSKASPQGSGVQEGCMVTSSSMTTSCTRTATTGTFASSFSMTPSGVSSGSMAVGLGMPPTPAPSFGEPSGRLVVEESEEGEHDEEEEEEEEEPKHWFVRDK